LDHGLSKRICDDFLVVLEKIGESAVADTNAVGNMFGDLFALNSVSSLDLVHAYVCGDSLLGRENSILVRVEIDFRSFYSVKSIHEIFLFMSEPGH
jgi:hypothetical protein